MWVKAFSPLYVIIKKKLRIAIREEAGGEAIMQTSRTTPSGQM